MYTGSRTPNQKYHQILVDFRRSRPLLIVYALATLFAAVGFAATDMFRHENIGSLAICVVALLAILTVAEAVTSHVIPEQRFDKDFRKLPKHLQYALVQEYKSAKRIGNHYYMESAFLFYHKKQIVIVPYADVIRLSPQAKNLLIHLKNTETPRVLPCPSGRVAAVAAAFIEAKNPEIKFDSAD